MIKEVDEKQREKLEYLRERLRRKIEDIEEAHKQLPDPGKTIEMNKLKFDKEHEPKSL